MQIATVDVWWAANEMLRMFGSDAELRAAARADMLLDEGDQEGFEVWRRIAKAIAELSRDKPMAHERVH